MNNVSKSHSDDIGLKYFDELYKLRLGGANYLDQPFMSGVKESVVEKYSDQAHFIYELIQNADDASATKARFVLKKDRLIFIHNGTRCFTITDPKREEEDKKNGILGDLNAITSIGHSSKTPASIGKFGLGFKAVFQYTDTPRICDKNIHIDLKRFIVPEKIEDDVEGRKLLETGFEFPFNHEDRNAEESVEDIKYKLNNLKYPILFLRNLKRIDFTTQDGKGYYKEIIKEEKRFDTSIFNNKKIQTTVKLIEINKKINDKEEKEFLYLFTRETKPERYVYSVGFFLNEDLKSIKPKDIDAFCFFTTKKHTNLKFIINAPFLLTDSREGIRAGKTHNINLIEKLSELAADSFIYLKEIGKEKKVSYINDNIFDIVPYDDSLFNDFDDKDEISFKPFYENIKKVFSTQKILPSSDRKFAKKDEAIWATVNNLVDLISNKQLSELFESSSKWVFVTKGRDNIQDRKLKEYIDAIIHIYLDEDVLLNKINSEFIQKQSHKWLSGLYKYLLATENRVRKAKYMPIFLNQNSEVVSAFVHQGFNGKPNLFFPKQNKEKEYNYVNEKFLSDNNAKHLLERLGIKTPTLKDEIYNIILPLYDDDNRGLDNESHFLLFFEYYKKCPNEEICRFINDIKDKAFISYCSISNPTRYRGIPSDLYFPLDNLKRFFESKPDTCFVDYILHKTRVDKNDLDKLNEFLNKLGVNKYPKKTTNEISYDSYIARNKYGINWQRSTRGHKWTEYSFDGFNVELFDTIKNNKDKELSLAVWHILVSLSNDFNNERYDYYYGYNNNLNKFLFFIEHDYFYRTTLSEYKTSPLGERIKKCDWLLDNDDNFIDSYVVYKEDLSPEYDINSSGANTLLRWLNIRNKPIIQEPIDSGFSGGDDSEVEEVTEPILTEEQKECIEFGQMAKALGYTKEAAETVLRKELEKKNRTFTSGLNFTSNNNSNSDDDVDDIEDKVNNTFSIDTIEIMLTSRNFSD